MLHHLPTRSLAIGQASIFGASPGTYVSMPVRAFADHVVSYTGFRRGNALDILGKTSNNRTFLAAVQRNLRAPPKNSARPTQMMFEHFTEDSIAVLGKALREARSSGLKCLGTEEILIGLIAYRPGIPARVLDRMGVSLEDARARIPVQTSAPRDFDANEDIPFTVSAKRVITQSVEESRQLGQSLTGPEHIFLALLKDVDQDTGTPGLLLHDLDVDPTDVCNQVLQMVGMSQDTAKTGRVPNEFT